MVPGQSSIAPRVILFIGDGFDDQQITIARNYLVGSNGRLVLDDMPYRGAMQVHTVDENDPGRPVYVGDSASGATAMATGVATSVGRIGTTASSDQDVANIMELAQISGISTGIVTTSSVTDASPAAFIAHINSRYCDVPSGMVKENKRHPQDSTDCSDDYIRNGGAGSIAEQIASSKMDLIIGGGTTPFAQTIEGDSTTTIAEYAQNSGFTFTQSLSELNHLGESARVLGLFSSGTMPVRLRGSDGGEARFIERIGDDIQWPEPFRCEENPEFDSVPTLAQMTKAALERLNGEAGFMLMVESSSIDKEAHYWRPCGHIGEVAQLDEAVLVALNHAKQHPETLILVTADHGQAAQLIPQISDLALQNYSTTGRFARVRTPEGGIMGINYATNNSPFWEEHSGVQVPIYASGPGVNRLPTFVHQTDVYKIAAAHLGLSEKWPPN